MSRSRHPREPNWKTEAIIIVVMVVLCGGTLFGVWLLTEVFT